MSTIRIAHISDLHFGNENQLSVWKSLAKKLTELKPEVIFITGDIVDSPKKGDYEEAKKCIDEIRIKYFVCPGNHDRHPKGNAVGKKLSKVWNFFSHSNRSPSWFDSVFREEMLSLREAKILSLGTEGNRWTLGLLGLDSSQNAKYSAQGYMELAAFDDLREGVKVEGVDLLLLLLHHHLLPIAELEKQSQSVTGLFNPTVMLNAGSVLENLAEGNVNLVLHGHEHYQFSARYRTVKGLQNEITIVGAGSGTGAQTLLPCEPSKASFNIFELKSDRTIWLTEYKNIATAWGAGQPLKLYSDGELRRLTLNRAPNTVQAPTSTITKHVEFTSARDILIREIRTNWVIRGKEFQNTISNSTGQPISGGIVLERQDSGKRELKEQYQPSFNNEDHTYILSADLGTNSDLPYSRVLINTIWNSGGLLTVNDLTKIAKTQRGKYRNQGYEFTAVTVTQPLAKVTIFLSLPKDFLPAFGEIFVIADKKSNELEKQGEQALELHESELSVEDLGMGQFMLSVPFPSVGTVYGIKWKLRDESPFDSASETFCRTADSYGNELVNAFSHGLPESIRAKCSVSLFVPHRSRLRTELLRKGLTQVNELASIEQPGIAIRADDLQSVYTRALWGVSSLMIRTPNQEMDGPDNFLDGEHAVIVLPIRSVERIGDPWGIVRVAFHDLDYSKFKQEFDDSTETLADAQILMLNEFIKLKVGG